MSNANIHKDDADIFSIKPETLRDILVKKHERFLDVYRKELMELREKGRREASLKKMVEILPDKKDLLDYWSKCLEEDLNKINDEALAKEIREKIAKFKKEKEDAEIELQMKLNELKEIEKEMYKDDSKNREEWLAKRIELHTKSLNFWKSYKIENE